ncbi:MAG: hypothetical protein ABJF01_21580 [bacterium]
MRMHRWIQRSIPLATIALLGAAPMVLAQNGGQEIFQWTGPVDREVQISMRGNQMWTRDVGGNEINRARARVVSQIPRRDGQVVVQVQDGRGNVDVIQQPSSQNGYMTVVRIRDSRGGADQYHITAYWESYSNGDYAGKGRGRDNRDNRDGRDGGYRPRDNAQNGRLGNQGLLHWSGNVDGELEIRMQNGRVEYRTISGAAPTSIRANVGSGSSPRTNATVNVAQSSGRGSVNVVQQPSSWNGYTTVVRVRDPQGGYGFYDFDLMWQ